MYKFRYDMFIVNPFIFDSLDSDAQAFITAASITDGTQKNAINDFYLDLKAAGIYTKMKAMYLPLFGSAARNKFNMVNPLDTDAAFRLVFAGGISHGVKGLTFTGTGYADTKLIPSVDLLLNDSHISVWNTADNAVAGGVMGVYDTGITNGLYMGLRWTNNDFYSRHNSDVNATVIVSTDATGFYTSTRSTNTSWKVFRNGSSYTTGGNSSSRASNPIFIGALNGNGTPVNYDFKVIPFASIGTGLSDADSTNFYNAVNTLLTVFGANV